MIHELRVYHCVPGKLPALLKRFETITLAIWEKHGIRQAGFWTVVIGESNKTLRPPPRTEAEVPGAYLAQLAAYRAAVAAIYPGRQVRCALLWTDGPSLMPVSAERLDRHVPSALERR